MSSKVKFENVKLWSREWEEGRYTYSVQVSSKKQDGSYDNTYLPVRFKSGVPHISNGSRVNLDGFLTCGVKKDGTKYIQMQVMDYEVLFDKPDDSADDELDSFAEVEEDLPF